MPLENVVDNLRDGYSQLEEGSLRQVDHLHGERQDNTALRNQWFYTADGQGYFLREDGGVDWAITPEDENLVLRHIDDEVNSSYDQLISEGNYRPDNAEAEAARRAEGTVVVNMSKLRLSGKDEEFRYLQIRTNDGFVKVGNEYKRPNREEQKAIQRLGYNAKTRKMLRESEHKIAETRIYVLDPNYVVGELEGSDDNSLWRASWLSYFYVDSYFDANDRGVYFYIALRGVRKTAEASRKGSHERSDLSDAPKNEVPQAPQEITPEVCYETLLADRGSAVAAMDDETATGLSAILTDYLATRAQ